MHADEVHTDVRLVRSLLAAQFPQWAALPVARVASSGTDNALYRIGADLVARLPRIERVVPQVRKERRWLPRLAPLLPLPVPVPVAVGAPGAGYPWPWSVCPWLPGANPTTADAGDDRALAVALARFVVALRTVDATGGPSPGEHNVYRGVPLALRDEATRAAIASLRGMIDTDAATAAWDAALRTPAWAGSPVWIHGDLSAGNILVRDGRLAAVIDFGCLGVGDPACDLIAAWNLLRGDAREAFRAGVGVDDAAWSRGRGWALSMALIQLPYYKDTNPALAASARHVIAQLI